MVKTLLPPNATLLELATEASMAIAFDHDIDIDLLWSAEKCPIELLPYLAWALSVDTWNADWPEHVKRQVVASSVYVHRFKGTPAGIKAALNALDLGVTISEWFEHGGEPFTFSADVTVTTRGLTDREFQDIIDVIATTKNARSHLSQLRIYLTTRADTFLASAAVMGERIDIQPWVATVPVSVPAYQIAAAVHLAETITTGENLV